MGVMNDAWVMRARWAIRQARELGAESYRLKTDARDVVALLVACSATGTRPVGMSDLAILPPPSDAFDDRCRLPRPRRTWVRTSCTTWSPRKSARPPGSDAKRRE
jgi:hypothetical protein